MFRLLIGILSLYICQHLGQYAAAQDIETVTCLGTDGDVKFEVQIDRTRALVPIALAMRVSDPNVSLERQEIAFFAAQEGVLSTNGNKFIGHVSEDHPPTGRRGERIGGTVLGALKQIVLEVEIDFTEEPGPRKRHAAVATYLKKNGEELVQDLDCRRRK
ncbi:MAG: hypothetical protein J0L82_03255 [Deltaproteobacteria bacterium]|nr:hypothetical protein [Deltaproteobacteria bacterium]